MNFDKKQIKTIMSACSTDALRVHLSAPCGVDLAGVRHVVATDGHMLLAVRAEGAPLGHLLLLPDREPLPVPNLGLFPDASQVIPERRLTGTLDLGAGNRYAFCRAIKGLSDRKAPGLVLGFGLDGDRVTVEIQHKGFTSRPDDRRPWVDAQLFGRAIQWFEGFAGVELDIGAGPLDPVVIRSPDGRALAVVMPMRVGPVAGVPR